MEESSEQSAAPETHWADKIGERCALWESVVHDSGLDANAQKRFLFALDVAKHPVPRTPFSLGDWAHDTINFLLNTRDQVIQEGTLGSDAQAIYQNLRDDIWDFCRELGMDIKK